jgi:fructosamine-3-kinase
MTKQQIIKYLKTIKLFKNPAVSKLGTGTNYDVFLIENDKKKFVLRTSKKGVATKNKLKNEYYILKFLQEQKINFIQQPIFFDRQKKLSILTYIPGKEIAISGLNNQQLKIFAKQVAKLHSIKYQQYQNFAKKNKLKLKHIKTPWENLKEYGLKRFKHVAKNCPEKYFVDWIKPKLEDNIKYIKNKKWTLNQIMLNHNDLAGSNIIISKSKVYFIDWEHAEFVYNTGTGIGVRHILNYDKKITKHKIKKLISLYNKYAQKNIKISSATMDKNAKIDKLNDVIWAAMTFTEMELKKDKRAKQYKKLTFQRIKEYEKNFEK